LGVRGIKLKKRLENGKYAMVHKRVPLGKWKEEFNKSKGKMVIYPGLEQSGY